MISLPFSTDRATCSIFGCTKPASSWCENRPRCTAHTVKNKDRGEYRR